MDSKIPFGDTTLGAGIALALIILAVGLGFGGCVYLGERSSDKCECAKHEKD